MNAANKVRSFLAAMGAEHSSIDNSFQGEYKYGDSTGNRTSALTTIENADARMKQRLGINQPITEIYDNSPMMNQQFYSPQTIMQPVTQMTQKVSREDRLNKLLGKSPQPQQPQIVQNNEHLQLIAAIKEALEPVTEQLEDIAILNGLLVQRIEKLIKVVDPDADLDDTPHTEQSISFQEPIEEEIPEPMEVYNPEVTMSLTDDEEVPVVTQTKKKRKKTT
jgi:hypothetical protein